MISIGNTSKVPECIRKTGYMALMGAGAILAPAISVVAIPVFAIKAAVRASIHYSLYRETLTDGQRVKYGRVEGQNYTRFDGKPWESKVVTKRDRLHEMIGQYPDGRKSTPAAKPGEIQSSPFATKEDLAWLGKEIKRREVKDLLESDLKMLRAFSKALIPIAGVVWVLKTELGAGGASEMGCRVCSLGSAALGNNEDSHWGWKEALEFHQSQLKAKLEEQTV